MLSCCLALVFCSACSRAYYRKQADSEVYCLVDHVAKTTGEAPAHFNIEVDRRSRMYDPSPPDCPPMPPDDPLAHRYMHCVDCKKGWPCWHCNGDTPYVASPDWLAYLPRNRNGELVLDQRAAVDLALLNSTEYQEQLEELYLSALDVTFERFRFDAQFFGGSSIFFTADGRNRPGSGGESSSVLQVNPSDPANPFRMTRFFTTGGELVVGLANSLVWEFSGPNSHSVNTLLDFSFVQPLLRAGGRARVMERLTIAERTLLANVRQMERYRRGFYSEIVTGRNAGQGPSRRGGFFGGAGLEGFSGIGGGGFGRVGNNARITATGTGAGAAQAGGYLGLLQNMQEIRNQEANVAALRVSLAQLVAFQEAARLGEGPQGMVQIGLASSALYNAESRLLTSKAQFQSSLDEFKLDLGLPPSIPLQVEDKQLDQFNLIDPELVEVQDVLRRLLEQVRTLEFAERGAAVPGAAGEADEPPAAEAESAIDVAALSAAAESLRGEIQRHLQIVQNDLQKMLATADRRRADLRRLAQREEVLRRDIDPNLLDVDRFNARIARLQQSFAALKERLECDWESLETLRAAHEQGRDLSTVEIPCRTRNIPLLNTDVLMEDMAAEGAPPDPAPRAAVRDRTPWTTVLTELSLNLTELSQIQARIRANTVTLPNIELTSEEALRIASRNRRDWANARAELVNAWRLIEFNANDLQSSLDLVFTGDIGNVGKNPVKLDASTGRLRVGARWDAPLTRLAERNVYRQSLIEYQQARRNYYRLVDQIERSLRETIRAIRLNDLNFEMRREAVQVALDRYHMTLLEMERPAERAQAAGVGQVQPLSGDFGATTARDMVDSLSDLQNAQNDFLSVWVNYEVQRLSLDLDLGTMQLDAHGQWIDPGADVGRNELGPRVYGGHGEYDIAEHKLLERELMAHGGGCDLHGHCNAAEEEWSDLEVMQLPELVLPEEFLENETSHSQQQPPAPSRPDDADEPAGRAPNPRRAPAEPVEPAEELLPPEMSLQRPRRDQILPVAYHHGRRGWPAANEGTRPQRGRASGPGMAKF